MSKFNVPPGASARVSIIDTGSRISCIPTDRLMAPKMNGFDHIPRMPSLSFLVESNAGQKAIFDLGVAKDWQDFAPIVSERLKANGYKIEFATGVAEVLTRNNFDLNTIDSIIWSHWHWDHCGSPATFPVTTELVVGPGFKENFIPAYPSGPESPVRECDFEGRKLKQIEFTERLEIGDFRTVDFFGDGSFYLLDTPGYAVGHLGALARTTQSPDTFIFMGGDLCHHSGEMRPSEHLPLPQEIEFPINSAALYPCPGIAVDRLQTPRQRTSTMSFFDPARGVPLEDCIETITKAQKADADENVLFIYAHEQSVTEVGDMFPLSANEWKSKGWREKMLWAFLRDFKSLV